MKKIFTLVIFLCAYLGVFAATVQVSTYAELKSAITAASDGDIIELTNIETPYDGAGADITGISKKITIIAAAGLTKKPEIKKFGFKLINGGSLHIEGIKAYYDDPTAITFTDSKYFLQIVDAPAATTIDYVKIINCEISNYGRGLIRADNSTNIATIGELTIDNSYFTNLSAFNSGYSILALKTAKVTTATIKNSTFYKCKSGIYYSEMGTHPINFLMDKVTIYNCGDSGAKEIIRFNPNPGSSYTISNSILWGNYDPAFAKLVINIGTTDGAVKLLNSIINVPTASTTGTISATWTENTEITDVTSFSLGTDLKITASKLLENIGDSRGYPMVVETTTSIIRKNVSNAISVNKGIISLNQLSNVEIYTITGKKVITAFNVKTISTENLTKGIYLVKTNTNGQNQVHKIIIQ